MNLAQNNPIHDPSARGVQALGRGFHTGARRLRSPLQDEKEGKEGKKK